MSPLPPSEPPFVRRAPRTLRYHLHVERLDAGGYDSGGRYFGLGETLYYYASVDGDDWGYVRALTRNIAKRKVRARVPGARFYR